MSLNNTTDHKPLLSLLNESKVVSPQVSARIQRWALTLSMYEYTLKFKPTMQHANADALSCLSLPETASPPLSPETVLLLEFHNKSPVIANQIRIWTRRDPLLSKITEYVQGHCQTLQKMALINPFKSRQLELSIQDCCISGEIEWLYHLKVELSSYRNFMSVTQEFPL